MMMAALILWSACNLSQKNSPTQQPIITNQVTDTLTEELKIKRGEYLVSIGGCHDCHSPKRLGPQGPELIPELVLSGYPASQGVPKFDSKLFAQGYAMFVPDLTASQGPWGISFAANLTPDDSGIGSWSKDQFKLALTSGISKGMTGNRPLLPPMPWMNYRQMTDEDVEAIFSYLKSIVPVKNVVPPPIPPSQR